jgi:hypothetical protein
MSLHLNDNEITKNNESMLEIMCIFGLDEEDLLEINRSDD